MSLAWKTQLILIFTFILCFITIQGLAIIGITILRTIPGMRILVIFSIPRVTRLLVIIITAWRMSLSLPSRRCTILIFSQLNKLSFHNNPFSAMNFSTDLLQGKLSLYFQLQSISKFDHTFRFIIGTNKIKLALQIICKQIQYGFLASLPWSDHVASFCSYLGNRN